MHYQMTMTKISLPVLLILFTALSARAQPEPTISSDFPGGNIRVVRMASDTIWLKPDLSETEGEWFYWYFRVYYK